MLDQILAELRNYFVKKIYRGKFKIVNNGLELPFMLDEQYFRIVGSIFNDGVYQYPAYELKDEEFVGEIWALAVPKEVVDLSQEVDAWLEKYGDSVTSPYNSESFGGYTYNKSGGYSTGGQNLSTWQYNFRNRLNRWRKL